MNRQVWDERSQDALEARFASWAEDDWEGGVDACLGEIAELAEARRHWYRPRFLDLGCGVGRLTLPMAAMTGCDVIGLDISPNMIGHAENRRQAVALDNVMFVIGNGSTLPNAFAPLALCWSVLLFQHCSADVVQGYISEVARLLDHDGIFRFQFVEEALAGPSGGDLDRHYPEDQVIGWCKDEGLYVPVVDRGHVHPQWTWLTCINQR